MDKMIPVIAIDGTAGSGKGTLAKRMAQFLQYGHLDTGKLYRGVAYLVVIHNVDTTDESAMVALVDKITPEILAHPEMTSNHIGNMASAVVSRIQAVRDALLDYQRNFPALCVQNGLLGAVIDGRDIGSVIFPDAPVKFYVSADVQVRAQRRYAELAPKNSSLKLDTILADMRTRDVCDTTAKVGRLIQTPDSIFIDTTHVDIDTMVQEALSHVKNSV